VLCRLSNASAVCGGLSNDGCAKRLANDRNGSSIPVRGADGKVRRRRRSPALYTQAVLQGAFILAKATGGAAVAGEGMTTDLATYLSFDGQREAAFKHYAKVLGGEILMMMRQGTRLPMPGSRRRPKWPISS
jgi:hypothetical protein